MLMMLDFGVTIFARASRLMLMTLGLWGDAVPGKLGCCS